MGRCGSCSEAEMLGLPGVAPRRRSHAASPTRPGVAALARRRSFYAMVAPKASSSTGGCSIFHQEEKRWGGEGLMGGPSM